LFGGTTAAGGQIGRDAAVPDGPDLMEDGSVIRRPAVLVAAPA